MRWPPWMVAVPILLVGCLIGRARAEPADPSDGRVHVVYWEKWTSFEKDAIKSVVDDFNRSQDRVFVDLVSVSLIRQKTLLATAGGSWAGVTDAGRTRNRAFRVGGTRSPFTPRPRTTRLNAPDTGGTPLPNGP